MGQDYYEILDIPRNATIKQINKAFRQLSLKYHPSKDPYSDCIYDSFLQVCEAYDVLSNQERRAIFDRFGEEGLKKGITQNGIFKEGYVYHENPIKTFRDFFGTENVFQDLLNDMDNDLAVNFGGENGRGKKIKDQTIERKLFVTLEEVYYGCVKKMKIMKRVFNPDGRTTKIANKILTVYVKRGWLEGTRITFPEEGDEGPNGIPADLAFTLTDREHPRFYREGHNLIYKTKIEIGKALVNCVVEIQTLDDRIIRIPVTEIVHPNYEIIVKGEGMPYTEKEEKGDLIIKFDLSYPRYLTPEQKIPIDEGFYRTH